MSRRVMIAAALMGSPAGANTMPRQAVPIHPKGYGMNSCATILTDSGAQAEADRLYIDGVWDGLNMSEDVDAGWSTDEAGIKGEVLLECQKRPSDILMDAISRARSRLKTAHR